MIYTPCPRGSRNVGFTRADVLGLLSALSLLALLLIGTGSVTRSTTEAVACLSHHRHLIRAWSEHAQDNQLLLREGWGGYLNWEPESGNTNVTTVLTPGFRPYVGSDAAVFRCPSDRFVSRLQLRRGWRHRLRTVSMNAHVGTSGRTVWGEPFPTYNRIDDFTEPSETFVFAEEHPGSINDASFATDPNGARRPISARLIDIPASFHARGANFGFADGHAELHRWVGPRVVQSVEAGVYLTLNVAARNDPDAIWLGLHASQRR